MAVREKGFKGAVTPFLQSVGLSLVGFVFVLSPECDVKVHGGSGGSSRFSYSSQPFWASSAASVVVVLVQ